MIAELIRFEPEICIRNRNYFKLKGESVSVMRNVLPAIHGSVSVMEINSSGNTTLYL